jgi:hypothetical protein
MESGFDGSVFSAIISGQKRMYLKRMRNTRVEIAILAA